MGITSALRGGGPLRPGAGLGPRVSRWLPVAVLAAALVVPLLWWALPSADGGGLSDRRLVGPRGPACLRLAVAVDLSGSMTGYDAARDQALSQLVAWASDGNLRPDDEITVVDFAADAALRVPVTPVTSVGAAAPPVAVPDGRFTNLGPVLDVLATQPAGPCDHALLLLSDAQLADLPSGEAHGRTVLAAHDLHDVVLLVPGDDIDVPPAWTTAFPSAPPVRFDGHDADETALAIGAAVARLTGQNLEES